MAWAGRWSVLAVALLFAQAARPDVYSAEDFRTGVRAYEAVYGAHRQRDQQLEGSAFEFLGYLKASIDAYNGIAFCMRDAVFPKAVSSLVRQYNARPDWRDRNPRDLVIDVLSREYPCRSTVRDAAAPARAN